MKLITAVVRPDIVDDLVLAVTEAGAHGLTATEVIGFGRQYGHDGERNSAALLPKVRLDIAVRDDDAQNVVETIAKRANTGAIGDGKIWVTTLDAALRVRTGETDDLAL